MFPEIEFGKKSEARNRLLADLLSRTQYMEKAGTGIKRVTNACKSNENQVSFNFSDSFWVTIRSNEKVVEKVVENITDNQKTIVELIKGNQHISARELAIEVGISHRKIQENIAKLKELGILNRIGPAKGGQWEVIGQ